MATYHFPTVHLDARERFLRDSLAPSCAFHQVKEFGKPDSLPHLELLSCSFGLSLLYLGYSHHPDLSYKSSSRRLLTSISLILSSRFNTGISFDRPTVAHKFALLLGEHQHESRPPRDLLQDLQTLGPISTICSAWLLCEKLSLADWCIMIINY